MTSSNSSPEFAGRILRARLNRAMSQAQAARELGVPLRTFCSWERGERVPATYTRLTMLSRLKNPPDVHGRLDDCGSFEPET